MPFAQNEKGLWGLGGRTNWITVMDELSASVADQLGVC